MFTVLQSALHQAHIELELGFFAHAETPVLHDGSDVLQEAGTEGAVGRDIGDHAAVFADVHHNGNGAGLGLLRRGTPVGLHDLVAFGF